MIKIGVLSDTHVKDRVRRLHPQVERIFTEANVDMIWHAGDVCDAAVLDDLRKIAPVTVVQGNADVMMGNHFPLMVVKQIGKIRIAMTHGQGNFHHYLRDRITSAVSSAYSFRYFEEQVVRMLPADADVLIFGHIHTPVNRYKNHQLLFNPGSTSIPVHRDQNPSIGILTIDNQVVWREIIPMQKIGFQELTWTMRGLVRINHFLGRGMPGLYKN
ncbi:MAG: metallophosphatase family protein [Anaerolineaceae bacterium]|nr:metallophosphatase family protein [Anaerolineaceae bacterium]